MSIPRIILPSLTSLRCLASSSTTITSVAACSTHIFRASYSSTGSSKRLLQTATHGPNPNSLDTEPPPPRGAGVGSSLTIPGNEHLPLSPPPAPQVPAGSTQSLFSAFTGPKNTTASTSTLQPTPAAKTSTATTRTKFRPRKAAMTLTSPAVQQLRSLLTLPEPKLIRVGVKNKGCSGLAYHLEYVDKPGKFDEEVVQEDVRVLIDSKALFSIIGSEMDWVEDKLSSRFVFRNPNIKDQCGCGESFSVG
ncbi:putative iron-sulfur cluster assembly accessory protein Isa1 [Morchella snyderi]|nr:putative iron-sulfur cluster assembly accessory protein Isa1 [Morchella snyderi]